MRTKQESGIIARVRQVMKEKAYDSQREFSKSTLITESVLSRLLSEKKQFNMEHLQAIERAYGVRYDWLLKGDEPMMWPEGKVPASELNRLSDGQMLAAFMEANQVQQNELARTLGKQVSTVNQYLSTRSMMPQTKQAIANALNTTVAQIFKTTPGAAESPSAMLRQRPVTATDDSVKVLRFPVRARGGLNYENFMDRIGEKDYDDIPRSWMKTDGAGHYPEHRIIEVDGDSMGPQLESGDSVLACAVNTDHLYRHIGDVLAVDFGDYFVIKRLKSYNATTGSCELVSDNPLGGSLTIERVEIRACWHCFLKMQSKVK